MNDLKLKSDPGVRSSLWSAALVFILVSHFLVDVFAAIVPASLTLIERQWRLTDFQSAWLLATGSLASGLAQPLFAWISDATNNRIFGALGLVLGAVFIGCLGIAPGIVGLFLFYMIGMAGNGMFHPIAASTIGALNPTRRGHAVMLFFIAGMVGGVTGSAVAPRVLVTEYGFPALATIMLPAAVLAFGLHAAIRGVSHRAPRASLKQSVDEPVLLQNNWRPVALLYAAAATRFTVNLALVYLYVRWMEQQVSLQHPAASADEIASLAAPGVGNLIAFTMTGMALGGLLAGLMIPSGHEKWPLVICPLLFAPSILILPYSSGATTHLLALLAGIGFAAMVPVTLTVAQRLLPTRTSLASGLMLGGAWSVAMAGPVIAERLIQFTSLEFAFLATAVLLAVSGGVLLPVRASSILQSASPVR